MIIKLCKIKKIFEKVEVLRKLLEFLKLFLIVIVENRISKNIYLHIATPNTDIDNPKPRHLSSFTLHMAFWFHQA